MSPRPDVSKERRNQIIDAASLVFARLGFNKARMEDISDEAKLSKGALYLYFKSKDAVITALLRRFFDPTLEDMRTLVVAPGTATERIRIFIEHIAAEIDMMAHLLPVAYEFYAVSMRQKSVREFLKDYYKEYRTLLATIIQQGIDSGEFGKINAGAAAIAIGGMIEGLTLLWLLDPKEMNWREMAEGSLRVVLKGLLAKDGK